MHFKPPNLIDFKQAGACRELGWIIKEIIAEEQNFGLIVPTLSDNSSWAISTRCGCCAGMLGNDGYSQELT